VLLEARPPALSPVARPFVPGSGAGGGTATGGGARSPCLPKGSLEQVCGVSSSRWSRHAMSMHGYAADACCCSVLGLADYGGFPGYSAAVRGEVLGLQAWQRGSCDNVVAGGWTVLFVRLCLPHVGPAPTKSLMHGAVVCVRGSLPLYRSVSLCICVSLCLCACVHVHLCARVLPGRHAVRGGP
jgi:hypothetical protein